MNSRRDLEELLRSAPFHSDAGASRARLDELLEQWDQSISRPGPAGGLGRHIMKSTTGKLAAAAIVLVLIGAGIVRFGGRNTGVALGTIVESMQRMPWIHITGTTQSPRRKGPIEEWQSFDRRILVWIDPNGVISYRDYAAEAMYVYQPGTNTVTISPITDRYNVASPGSPVGAIQEMIASQEQAGAQVAYDAMTYNGVPARKIHIVAQEQDTTLICDRDSGLPLSIQSVATLPETHERAVVSMVFEYPTEGPADIYALGAPADAKVVDNRPKGSAADLVEQVQRRFDAGFEDHIAVLLESYVNGNETLEPARIVVMWQQGRRKRMGRYHAYNFGDRRPEMATLYPAIKDLWPNLTIADVLGLISDEFAEYQLIFDGATSTNWSKFSGQVNVQTIKPDLFQTPSMIDWLTNLAGTNPILLMSSGPNLQKRLETSGADPNHPGLVGFRVVTTPSDSSGRLPGTTARLGSESYWFDPNRDYLLIERLSRNERDEGIYEFLTKTTEVAQTPGGKWYPRIIRILSSYPAQDGLRHNTRERRILLDTSPVFEPGTFDATALGSGPSAAR
jgi:hypothetical protein